ncbi:MULTISPECIES: GPO family capsid scaffolding protein [Pectobacterium]|uniref:GPO family capsid scaffolding protein n=1 Tax=Pectobacterium TaxID=122277 RepID=UPI000503D608|nr:GPO family capsid scaffolding protein [Pectobacterium carotovorum]KFW97879.1 precorrin-8W decarboxylase [Pectobacterium carotovorum subsp. carotovorum]KML68112.1 precorrin-8W decarboxylase [Pectobacterium carotovorum subsp. carotovorum ICMP 5702]SHH66252.1 Phage capsid scaffolding protein (GPO) serine peptidase [Pectobacterium carotovorum]
MAKKVSKFFRVGVEGDTCDGRVIDANDIQNMAETFDPRVYGCRINLEHLKGLLPDSPFRRYGDVVELKAETIDDDSAISGKLALFAKITPTDELVAMNKASQKIYTSMEIQPNFANTGKAYLVGLAVTDDPASLGTEMLEFSAKAKLNPLATRKSSPENLFSVATEVTLEFEDLPDVEPTLLTRVKALFGRKQSSDDARFNDVHEAVAEVAGQVQTNADSVEQRFTQLEQRQQQDVAALTQKLSASEQQLSDLKATLDGTESLSQKRRPAATGGDGEATLLTNC